SRRKSLSPIENVCRDGCSPGAEKQGREVNCQARKAANEISRFFFIVCEVRTRRSSTPSRKRRFMEKSKRGKKIGRKHRQRGQNTCVFRDSNGTQPRFSASNRLQNDLFLLL